jgi:hypothetical protein
MHKTAVTIFLSDALRQKEPFCAGWPFEKDFGIVEARSTNPRK